MTEQSRRRISQRDRRIRRSNRQYKHLNDDDLRESTKPKRASTKTEKKSALSRLNCVNPDYDLNEIEMPPLEDKVDAIVLNSFIECGREMKSETKIFSEKVSKSINDSHQQLRQLQAIPKVAKIACVPNEINPGISISDLKDFAKVIPLFPRKVGNREQLQQKQKQRQEEIVHTLTIKSESTASTVSSEEVDSILNVRAPLPFSESTRESRRKYNIFLRNRSKETKRQQSYREPKVASSNFYPDTTLKSPLNPAKQVCQLYPKVENIPIRSKEFESSNTRVDGSEGTHNDTTELLNIIGTTIPLVRKVDERSETKHVDDNAILPSCHFVPFSIFERQEDQRQDDFTYRSEGKQHFPNMICSDGSVCSDVSEPIEQNFSEIQKRKHPTTLLNHDSTNGSIVAIIDPSTNTATCNNEKSHVGHILDTMSQMQPINPTEDKKVPQSKKTVTFSPETNYSEDKHILHPFMRTRQKTRMRRLRGFVEV